MEAEQVVLPQRTTTTYTVLRRSPGGDWQQMKDVVLQSRQHRKGAIPLALEGGSAPDALTEFRVLDEAAAQVYKLKRRPKPPVAEEFEVFAL